MMMTRQAGVHLTPTNERNASTSQQQPQQEIRNTPTDSDDVNNSRRLPNLPPLDLLTGPRNDYLDIFLPLYEASVKCDWKAAEAIFEKKPELVRYSITENGETALHVAASAKVSPELGEVFVKNLVDLMDKETLALENKNFNTALYLAAIVGNLKNVQIMVEKYRELMTIPGAGRQMLPLHAAALFKKYKVVEYLFGKSNDLCDEDGWNDTNRGWLLEKCVENDMLDIALQIVKKYPELGRRGSVLGILARKPDAFAKKPNFILSAINRMGEIANEYIDNGFKKDAKIDEALPLLRFILDDIVRLPKNEIDSILIRGPNVIKQANKSVSSKVDQALELQKLISDHIVNMHVETQNILEQDSKATLINGHQAVQLEKVISEHITKMQVKTQNIITGHAKKDTHFSEAVFSAAEMGNTIFLVELIRRYPDIMWKVNDSNQTIFHIAVENRHADIYTMLYELGFMKDSITSLDDENGNNLLHLVAKIAKKKKLEEVPGVVFQMQQELLWFKEVKSMMNPSCIEQKNKDGLTPQELFTKEHEDLLAQSVKWVKGTANQCMVVAALVATIAFAAAITIPGGYNQDNGIPIFYRDPGFTIFMLTDAFSLLASSVSILFFIAILASRFTERDFLQTIPLGFSVFFATLLFSVITMIFSFCVSFFVIYHEKMQWIPLFTCAMSGYTLFVYLMVQLAVSYKSWQILSLTYLFNPEKHVLYYQNPVL